MSTTQRLLVALLGTLLIIFGTTATVANGPSLVIFPTETNTPRPALIITQVSVTQVSTISPPLIVTTSPVVVTATPPALSAPTTVIENFEAEWPPAMQLKQSDEVRVSLVYTSGQTLTPIIEVPGHTAIIGTPIPLGTAGPLAAALGPEYDTFIIATLGSTAFDIVPATAEEYRLLGPTKVTWTWNVIPKYRGNQVLNVSVDVRWEPKNGEKPIRYQVWRKRLETTVGGPLFEIGDPIQITPILTAVGGALAAWFGPRLYKWGVAEIQRIGKQRQRAKNRRQRR